MDAYTPPRMEKCSYVVDSMRLKKGTEVEPSSSQPSMCGSNLRFRGTIYIGKNSRIHYGTDLGWYSRVFRDVTIGRKVYAEERLKVEDGACIEGSIRFGRGVRIPRNACVIRDRRARHGYRIIRAEGRHRCHYDERRDRCTHKMRYIILFLRFFLSFR